MGAEASKASRKYLVDKHAETLRRLAGSHEFYFLLADRLLEIPAESDDPPLPIHQELLKRGCLIKKTLLFYILLNGGYQDVAMISHRWITPKHPDPNNEQLVKIQEFLRANPHIKLVWLDYGCIPQGKRTEDEETHFRSCLDHISLLYLSLPVVVIFDKQYISRFWCIFEMYLSLRKASEEGIGPASEKVIDSRFHFYCIGSAKRDVDGYKLQMIKDWKDLNASNAADVLKEDDIMVTNRRDKDEQLAKLVSLDLRIRKILVNKTAELGDMTRERQAELANLRSVVARLPEVRAKQSELKKKLAETEEELRRMEELAGDAPDIKDLDEELDALLDLTTDRIWSTQDAFVAKLKSGKSVAWGSRDYGGDLAPVQAIIDADGLDQVWSTGGAFVAKLNSGKAVAWGRRDFGGDLAPVKAIIDADGLDQVWSTGGAFVAKLNSGKAVAWGHRGGGGDLAPVQAILDSEFMH